MAAISAPQTTRNNIIGRKGSRLLVKKKSNFDTDLTKVDGSASVSNDFFSSESKQEVANDQSKIKVVDEALPSGVEILTVDDKDTIKQVSMTSESLV